MTVRRRAGSLVTAAVALALALALCQSTGTASAHARWSPPAHLTWYWQLQGRVRIENVDASDIDAFGNGAAEVARLHGLGQHVICYVDVGSWERWRPDAGRFPRAVLNAEYRRSLYPGFCANDRRLGISGALYALDLNGTLFEPCAVNSDSLRL
jgi:hypothetical protein